MTNTNISKSDSIYEPAAEVPAASSISPADEIVLQLRSDDRLGLAWGGMVVQKAGMMPVGFAGDESHYLVFVVKGVFKARAGQAAFTVTEGCALTLLPGETCTWAEPNETDLQFLWLAYWVPHSGSGKQAAIRVPRVGRVPDARRMAELLRLLTEEYHINQFESEPHVVYSTAVHHLLLSVLARLDISEPKSRPPLNASTFLAEQAKNYIRLNITRPITTSDVAKAVDCSTSYLGAVFQKAYGESVVTYIQRTRIDMSHGLLVGSRMSIGEVGRMVGFPNLNYFSRIFRRYRGITPSAYRLAHCHSYVTTNI